MANNLYKVTVNGFYSDYHSAYVIAENSDEAYKKYKNFLVKEQIGTSDNQEFKTIELLASDERYPSCGVRLFF